MVACFCFHFSSLSFWNPNKLFDVAVFLSLDGWSCLQHPTEMEKCLMGNFGLPNRPARAGNSSHSSLLSPYICQKAPEHGWVLRGSPHCPLLSRLPLSTSPLRGPGLSPEAHGSFPSATLSSLTDISWTLVIYFLILSSSLSSQCPLLLMITNCTECFIKIGCMTII